MSQTVGLSDNFIREFQNRLDLDEMLDNENISQELYDELTGVE